MIKPLTQVNCGPISVEFFDSLGNPPDSATFSDERTADSINNFRMPYSEDISKKGSYSFKYRVFHKFYPGNIATQFEPFTITVINSCENPKSLLPSKLQDQDYTITQTFFTYQIQKFVI